MISLDQSINKDWLLIVKIHKICFLQATVLLQHKVLTAVRWMETKWIGAAWCCTPPLRSRPLTYYPQQGRVPVSGVSLVVCPRPPVIPFPLAALYFLTDRTSVARSAHWIRTPAEARWLAQTATRPTRGAVIPTVTMTLLDQDGWRPRLERQRRGAALEAPTGRRGRPSSAPRGGQCLIPQPASLSHNSRCANLKRTKIQNTQKFDCFLNCKYISVIWFWVWMVVCVGVQWAGDLSRAYPASSPNAAGIGSSLKGVRRLFGFVVFQA